MYPCTGGVRIQPGHTALTRMPSPMYCSAAVRVSPTTPCLAALYETLKGKARRPSTEELLTMAPPLPRCICGISYFMHSHTLFR